MLPFLFVRITPMLFKPTPLAHSAVYNITMFEIALILFFSSKHLGQANARGLRHIG